MKNVQIGAKIKREKERRQTEASAQGRDKMHSTDLSNIRMNKVNGMKGKNQEVRINNTKKRRGSQKSVGQQLAQTEGRRSPNAATKCQGTTSLKDTRISAACKRVFNGIGTTCFCELNYYCL